MPWKWLLFMWSTEPICCISEGEATKKEIYEFWVAFCEESCEVSHGLLLAGMPRLRMVAGRVLIEPDLDLPAIILSKHLFSYSEGTMHGDESAQSVHCQYYLFARPIA